MPLIVEATSSIVRPDDVTPYSIGDLIANSTVAGSVEPLIFDLEVQFSSQCFIRRARFMSSIESLTNAEYKLHLFTKRPTVVNGDNGALSTTKAGYIGSMDVVLDQVFSDGSFGVALPTVGSELNFISEGTKLYGLLEASAAQVPEAESTIGITLEIHRY